MSTLPTRLPASPLPWPPQGLPLLLGPLHIAFLEMVIDRVCSLAFEVESGYADAMQRPPRARGARLFSRHRVLRAALQGLLALGLPVGLTLVLRYQGVAFGLALTVSQLWPTATRLFHFEHLGTGQAASGNQARRRWTQSARPVSIHSPVAPPSTVNNRPPHQPPNKNPL
jgi:hypothetical protein